VSAPIFHDETPRAPLAEIGRYPRLAAARERGLVIAAMDRPHWITRQGREYVLSVEIADEASARAAVAEYDREEAARPVVPPEPFEIPVFATVMTLLGLVLLFAVQLALPSAWVEQGVADDLRIRAGEWWRVATALTLHGDLEHLVSNLSLGIFVTILSGMAGNALNVLAHWYQPHRSIGSSTALFAGLGLLAGAELAARLRHESTRGFWSLIVPLGAGLTFLSLFGGGGVGPDGAPLLHAGRVDIMAHLLGLGAGLALGAVFFALGARRGLAPHKQAGLGVLGLGFLLVSWSAALWFGRGT
jgi:rhomboid protease GluP